MSRPNLFMFNHCFAVPGANTIIDVVDPKTGRTVINGETLSEVRVRYPEAQPFTLDAWREDSAKRQQTPLQWVSTTKQQYSYAMEVLPPAAWTGNAFLVGEPMDHCHATGRPRFEGYNRKGGRYFVSSRPMTLSEFSAFAANWGGAK